ncbi:HNH endonuclease signature motif containing protein [Streptomyces alboniger]|uniref:HNH endonuclease n=1 Tax=Streptomyces alboniger TaxID=132473 RepID=A0A5J6HDK1_STRAD|nr:HNH endonuclease signature motif containing protein [Streptomyces alboniger]QEV18296.1 HNH endonuclease [Streptomyces alboniger]
MSKYPRELLESAAAVSTSLVDLMRRVGAPMGSGPQGYLRSRLGHYGIDTSHFAAPRATRGADLFPEEEFTRAVAASHGLADLMRRLGLPPLGGAGRAKAKRSIDEYGLSTEHFMGQGHNAGRRPPTTKGADEILIRLDGGSARTRTHLLRRALDDSGVPHVCAACGLGEIRQGMRLVLEIDHINGDRLDNRRVNLRYLCPSCHSQTTSFAVRSRTRP